MKFKLIYTFFFLMLIVLFACENTITKNELSESEKEAYLKKGQEITNQTFAALGGKLQKAMKEGGVSNAVNYCKINAMPIVDSISTVYNCEIRRVTMKARNPVNKATRTEKKIIKSYEQKIKESKFLDPIVVYNQTKSISYFAPIKVNGFCLQCHGKIGDTLKEDDYALIKKQYPNDNAIGYLVGDLRGMWRVTFQE